MNLFAQDDNEALPSKPESTPTTQIACSAQSSRRRPLVQHDLPEHVDIVGAKFVNDYYSTAERFKEDARSKYPGFAEVLVYAGIMDHVENRIKMKNE